MASDSLAALKGNSGEVNILDILGISYNLASSLESGQLLTIAKKIMQSFLTFYHPDTHPNQSPAKLEIYKQLSQLVSILDDQSVFEVHRIKFLEREEKKISLDRRKGERAFSVRRGFEERIKSLEETNEHLRSGDRKFVPLSEYELLENKCKRLEAGFQAKLDDLKGSKSRLENAFLDIWECFNPDFFTGIPHTKEADMLVAAEPRIIPFEQTKDMLVVIFYARDSDNNGIYRVAHASRQHILLTKMELIKKGFIYTIDGDPGTQEHAKNLLDTFRIVDFSVKGPWRSWLSHPFTHIMVSGVEIELKNAETPIELRVMACSRYADSTFHPVPGLYPKGVLLGLADTGLITVGSVSEVAGHHSDLKYFKDKRAGYLKIAREKLQKRQKYAKEEFRGIRRFTGK